MLDLDLGGNKKSGESRVRFPALKRRRRMMSDRREQGNPGATVIFVVRVFEKPDPQAGE
jgi:hypothetical protein